MGEIGNLHIGDLNKKKEELNKTGGINTKKSVFNTEGESENMTNPYAVQNPYMNRVEELANRGPLMQSRIHTKNSNDIARPKMKETSGEGSSGAAPVKSEEKQNMIKAKSELKVFSGDVMKKGTFTPEAKEAARHFFRQVSNWAGSFNDGGSGFYGSMGISSVIDCLYVDGMSLRNYLKEQYLYKTTGNPAQDQENIRNYIALIAARGDHVITMVRPTAKGDSADVEYRNMYVDLSDVGEAEASKARALREKGNHVRSELKKRMDKDMTEQTGMAYRKAYGCESDGFKRIEGAKAGLDKSGDEDSPEYAEFNKSFEHYNGGLQRLGLKPGRDDINLAVARELKSRCEDALKDADSFLRSGSKNEKALEAAKAAKKALETDMELLNKAIETKLSDEEARMRLDELFDSKCLKDPGNRDNNRDSGDTGSNDEEQDT